MNHWILPFRELGLADIARVGGKNASLGQLLRDVPDSGLGIGIEYDVGGVPAERIDDGQSQAHACPPQAP